MSKLPNITLSIPCGQAAHDQATPSKELVTYSWVFKDHSFGGRGPKDTSSKSLRTRGIVLNEEGLGIDAGCLL